MVLLFGSDMHNALGLLMLGFQLKHMYSTRYEMLLMYSDDVPKWQLDVLSNFWKLKLVADVPFEGKRIENALRPEMRRVTTKLRLLQLVEFKKILFLDCDVMLKQSLDDIFNIAAPAGVEVSWDWEPLPKGTTIPADRLVDPRTQELKVRMNAGVLLLEPSIQDFDELYRRSLAPELDTYNPEEDLMTPYFKDRPWTSLGLENNLELFRFPVPGGALKDTPFKLLSEAVIVHFSQKRNKPWWCAYERNFETLRNAYWRYEYKDVPTKETMEVLLARDPRFAAYEMWHRNFLYLNMINPTAVSDLGIHVSRLVA